MPAFGVLPPEPSLLCVSVPVIADTSRFVFKKKMAAIIETEFRIRTLQAALVERRNKDRLGHLFL